MNYSFTPVLKNPSNDSIRASYISTFVTREVINISTRFVVVSHSFFLRRSINFPDAYELPAPVSISGYGNGNEFV